jgi:hypothetical protein
MPFSASRHQFPRQSHILADLVGVARIHSDDYALVSLDVLQGKLEGPADIFRRAGR